jgi:hypothetical protein
MALIIPALESHRVADWGKQREEKSEDERCPSAHPNPPDHMYLTFDRPFELIA